MTKNTRPPDASPTGWRWLLLVLLAVAVIQLGGAVRVLQWPDAPNPLSPVLRTGLYGFWALLTLGAASAVWRGSVRFGLLVLLAFTAYSAGWMLLFTRADYERARLPFLLAVLGVIMIGLFVALLRNRPRPGSDQSADE